MKSMVCSVEVSEGLSRWTLVPGNRDAMGQPWTSRASVLKASEPDKSFPEVG